MEDGFLAVTKGDRLEWSVPCQNITGLWVRGGSGWRDVLNPMADVKDGKFPHLVVWDGDRRYAPPILLVGAERIRCVEQALIDVCRSHGAPLRRND